MDSGIVSSAHLPTAFGEFNIHVLPEKVKLGVVKGRPAATFLEHYAMVPTAFDPHKPVAIHVHHLDIFEDLFCRGSGKELSVPKQILKKLSNGENGILLYVDRLDDATKAQLKDHVDKPEKLETAAERRIVDYFANYLRVENPKIVATGAMVAKRPAAKTNIETDLGPFEVRRMDEIVRVDFPEAALRSLFPRDAGIPADRSPIFLKHLAHYALIAPRQKGAKAAPFVRIHSSCATGDINSSYRCDCGLQFRKALGMIAEHGGAVIYHDAEGRGIHSLAIKMHFYKLHREGFDTYTSMTSFGYAEDCRDYKPVGKLLREIGMTKIVLLTNNPRKMADVAKAGIEIAKTARVRMSKVPEETKAYLDAKKTKGGHKLK